MTSRKFTLALVSLIVLCLLAIAGAWRWSEDQAPAADGAPSLMTAAKIGGAFTLTDQTGSVRTNRDFSGKYKLIYFGFTYCPAVCPTELQKIAEALRVLPVADLAKIKPLFITVDPERDTPDILRTYVAQFDRRLTGLTGTKAQIAAVEAAYKVYAAKVPQGDTYTMDHTSFIYFMTPQDTPLYMFRIDDSAATMAATIAAYFKTHP